MSEIEKSSDSPFNEDGLKAWVNFFSETVKPMSGGLPMSNFNIRPVTKARNPDLTFREWELRTEHQAELEIYRKKTELRTVITTIIASMLVVGVASALNFPGILLMILFFATSWATIKINKKITDRKIESIYPPNRYGEYKTLTDHNSHVEGAVGKAWAHWNDALAKIQELDSGGPVYSALMEEDERMRAGLSDYMNNLLDDVEIKKFKEWFFLQAAKAQQLVSLEAHRINLAERRSVSGGFTNTLAIDAAAVESREVTESVRKALGN